MLGGFAKSVFGSSNERFIKKLRPLVAAINEIEPALEKLSDEDLKARTDWLRGRLDEGESLDDILCDAFATVREAAKRTLGQRHFDVQMMGGVVLHRGMIAEMTTGEGKTLVATLSVYLNALSGKGVHVVTVNDYLAQRDAEWMGEIYKFLGLTVGCIVNDLDDEERQIAYNSDVTYGTNNEFGFDYLRDNMKYTIEEMVQRKFNYAIVDEVDSILVDEARTPLIISGPAEDSSELYHTVDKLIPKLSKEHYDKDEKARTVSLSDAGIEKIEEMLAGTKVMQEGGLFDISNISVLHHVNQALRAHTLFALDTDYIVNDGKVIIIDEFTGRMMEGRRYSEGLHQALEAKEHVEVEMENQTLASITFQNYFRLYPKLAGMTGTAMTEAGEFHEIYKLEVIEVPTNLPCIREDNHDEVYRTADEKYVAVLDQIEDCHKRKQPILVGTVSIEKSETLAALLEKRKIPHNVLNARHHAQEASIIAQAGKPGAVTIATNMAGRGTDIQLGGNADMLIKQHAAPIQNEKERAKKVAEIEAEVAAGREIALKAGGCFVLATERHESRRIDNQLRGRSGRQGDPGASKFYLSLQDDLMRIFGSERMDGVLKRLGLKEGEAIIHPWINRALLKAQEKVEARNFEIRKNLLKFDDVMNDQRKVIYEQRRDLMQSEDVSDTVESMRHEVIDDLVATAIPENAYAEQWNTETLQSEVHRIFDLDLPIQDWAKEEGIADQEVRERITEVANKAFAKKVADYTPEVMRMAEKSILLQLLDQTWKDHLLSLDHLRQGINLRAYAQKDPLNEYKREAFDLFSEMLASLRENVTGVMSHLEIQAEEDVDMLPHGLPGEMHETRLDPALEMAALGNGGLMLDDAPPGSRLPLRTNAPAAEIDPKKPATWGKVSRNAPCPCGSGKKFKRCHGRVV
ncbi:MAG: preprotein translocase subunit SecA [Alphaproteobacteria bacterium]|nr:preprotein translocase subunit SecA [Alphaproteobacteria bacterium]